MKARIPSVLLTLVLLSGVLLSGCYGLSPSEQGSSGSPVSLEGPECVSPVKPLKGFVEVDRRAVPQGGVVGLQIFYDGPEGRTLTHTAGVLADMFETAPLVEDIPLTWGGTASLFRHARDKWILFWYEDNACRQYTIGGAGFSQEEFMRLLRDEGVLEAKT